MDRIVIGREGVQHLPPGDVPHAELTVGVAGSDEPTTRRKGNVADSPFIGLQGATDRLSGYGVQYLDGPRAGPDSDGLAVGRISRAPAAIVRGGSQHLLAAAYIANANGRTP